jgi:hypothetical protein
MKKIVMTAVALFMTAMQIQAQTPAELKYIVKTIKMEPKVEKTDSTQKEEKADDPVDFFDKYFRYVSMCDWQPGMRFMVIPSQADLVVKTFTDAETGQMVSSRSLRHKIMIYQGHENTGGLHEHVNFTCEDDGKAYYFEVPTASFSDYCYGKTGVPTLAYLGDVDVARDVLLGKQVVVNVKFLYQDTEIAGDGYKMVDLESKQGDIMTIKAIGVGTRNYPVKIIVKDRDSIEYFQMVTISHTNCGMRDDEFEKSDILPHTFKGSFELLGDNMSVSPELQQYIDKEVYSLYSTNMTNAQGKNVRMARLSTFVIKNMQKRAGSDFITVTLEGIQTKHIYTKQVLMEEKSVIGDIAGQREDFFGRLFAFGDPLKIDGVRKANLANLSKGVVQQGYTEAEVRLALGEPTDTSSVRGGEYTWTYQYVDSGSKFRVVVFNASTHKVKRVTR